LELFGRQEFGKEKEQFILCQELWLQLNLTIRATSKITAHNMWFAAMLA
jgi:hypothetical protein